MRLIYTWLHHTSNTHTHSTHSKQSPYMWIVSERPSISPHTKGNARYLWWMKFTCNLTCCLLCVREQDMLYTCVLLRGLHCSNNNIVDGLKKWQFRYSLAFFLVFFNRRRQRNRKRGKLIEKLLCCLSSTQCTRTVHVHTHRRQEEMYSKIVLLLLLFALCYILWIQIRYMRRTYNNK